MGGKRPELRHDRPANLAVLAGIASAIGLTVATVSMAVPQGYLQARGDPRYWLLMVPVAVWAWSAVDFSDWALRVLPVVLVGAPIIATVLASTLPGMDEASQVTWWVVAGFSLVCGAAGWRWKQRSGLA